MFSPVKTSHPRMVVTTLIVDKSHFQAKTFICGDCKKTSAVFENGLQYQRTPVPHMLVLGACGHCGTNAVQCRVLNAAGFSAVHPKMLTALKTLRDS